MGFGSGLALNEMTSATAKGSMKLAGKLSRQPARPTPLKLNTAARKSFAVFRSAVDSWAIQQLFPIVPIHR